MVTKLPARPSLDHLRSQAKTLLKDLKGGSATAAQAFITHLPAAKKMKPAAVRAAGFRLADAQSVVARQSGFASWPLLARHVEQLRALEGEWRIESLEVEGTKMPPSALKQSRVLIDGDRFRVESPEGTYEGILTIDVAVEPSRIDIAFVAGPDAGETCYGIYELKTDVLTLCLGVVGSSRPAAFISNTGTGHALERLRRASSRRPARVTGGTPPAPEADMADREDPSAFDVPMTPMLRRLEGAWVAVELASNGKPMPEEWLSHCSRTAVGNEVTVVVGGQKIIHAKVRVDESATPIAIDYLQLDGRRAGVVTRGIMEWIGEDVRFLSSAAGQPRPAGFDVPAQEGTASRWRRK